MNPNYKDAFGDYLVANGFKEGNKSPYSDTLYFFKNDAGVMISGDAVDVGQFNPTIDGVRQPGCIIHATFTGISRLDEFSWMLLMHITGAVPLKEFVKNASNAGVTNLLGNISRVFDPHAKSLMIVH
jgi:hypothetical protein